MFDAVPIKLTSPRVWRTYQGGSRIDAIHGIPDGTDSQFPEEWIISTVVARNVGREQITNEGLCYLAGTETTLRDYILAQPEQTLGKNHLNQIGATTGVLVKIIDSAERLTVQVHPNKQRAMELFQSPFGKTECWHILDCRPVDGQEPCIYMGFKEHITREYWQQIFLQQDIPAMLNCLHRFPVQPGQTYLIHGGVPHAIGAGCLLVEIQEPTDYTVRTELVSPTGLKISDYQCHQGLGFEKMFDCFDYDGISFQEAKNRWCIPPEVWTDAPDYTHSLLIGEKDTSCFRLERLTITDSCTLNSHGKMSGIYVLEGAGQLSASGKSQSFIAGDQFFVPASCTGFTITAESPVTAFRFFGPSLTGEE